MSTNILNPDVNDWIFTVDLHKSNLIERPSDGHRGQAALKVLVKELSKSNPFEGLRIEIPLTQPLKLPAQEPLHLTLHWDLSCDPTTFDLTRSVTKQLVDAEDDPNGNVDRLYTKIIGCGDPVQSGFDDPWLCRHYLIHTEDQIGVPVTVNALVLLFRLMPSQELPSKLRVSDPSLTLAKPGFPAAWLFYDTPDPGEIPVKWPTPSDVDVAVEPPEKDHLFRTAEDWNGLAVDLALLEAEIARASRGSSYAGDGSSLQPLEDLETRLTQLRSQLGDLHCEWQTLHKQYGDLGQGDVTEAQFWTAFAGSTYFVDSSTLRKHLKRLSCDVRRFMSDLAAGSLTPADWASIPNPPSRSFTWWDGGPKHLLWGRRSRPEFGRLEQPLDLGGVYGMPGRAPDGLSGAGFDWTKYLEMGDHRREGGACQLVGLLPYGIHDHGYIKDENGDWDWELIDLLDPSLTDPATGYIRSVLEDMRNVFRDRDEYLLFIDCWEDHGPYKKVEIGDDEWEYSSYLDPENQVHIERFHKFLEQRYSLLAKPGQDAATALNDRWQLSPPDVKISALSPEVECPVPFPSAADPPTVEVGPDGTAETAEKHLGNADLLARSGSYLETRRWLQEEYVDYLRLIKETFQGEEAGKPIMADPTFLLERMISPRLIQTVDLFAGHNHPEFLEPWLRSLQRYLGGARGVYEHHWRQDGDPRWTDERVMLAQARLYSMRFAGWGRVVQIWTGGDASIDATLLDPRSNWTLLRYSSAGVAVEKKKLERLEGMLLESEELRPRVLVVQPYSSMLAQGAVPLPWLKIKDAKGEENPGIEVASTFECRGWQRLLAADTIEFDFLPDYFFPHEPAAADWDPIGGNGPASCSEDDWPKLSDYDAVILPMATHLSVSFSCAVADYISKGGLAICSGAPDLFDEFGNSKFDFQDPAKSTSLLSRIESTEGNGGAAFSYGLQAGLMEWSKRGWYFAFYDAGAPMVDKVPIAPNGEGWIEGRYGQGRLLLLPFSLATRMWPYPVKFGYKIGRQELQKPIDRLMLVKEIKDVLEQGGHRYVRIEGPRSVELIPRQTAGGRYLLCVGNRNSDRPTKARIVLSRPISKVADIDLEPPLEVPIAQDGKSFQIDLLPGDTAYYLIEPKENQPEMTDFESLFSVPREPRTALSAGQSFDFRVEKGLKVLITDVYVENLGGGDSEVQILEERLPNNFEVRYAFGTAAGERTVINFATGLRLGEEAAIAGSVRVQNSADSSAKVLVRLNGYFVS